MRIQDHCSISVNLDVAQASCDRLTENVCAVCDVMEMCVSDCIRISESTAHTFSVRRSQDACDVGHGQRAGLCPPRTQQFIFVS